MMARYPLRHYLYQDKYALYPVRSLGESMYICTLVCSSVSSTPPVIGPRALQPVCTATAVFIVSYDKIRTNSIHMAGLRVAPLELHALRLPGMYVQEQYEGTAVV